MGRDNKFDRIARVSSEIRDSAGLKEKASASSKLGKKTSPQKKEMKERLIQFPKDWDDAIVKHLLEKRLSGEGGNTTFASWVRDAIKTKMKKDGIKFTL